MPFRVKPAKVISRIKAVFTPKRTGRLAASPSSQSPALDESSAGQINAAAPHTHPVPPHTTETSALSQPSVLAAHDSNPDALSAQVSSARTIAVADVGDHDLSDEGNKSRLAQGYNVFKSALKLAKEIAEPFPHVKGVIGAVLHVMEGFENVNAMQEGFTYAGRKVHSMLTIYNQHRSQLEVSESTKASMESLAQAMRIVEKTVQAKLARGLLRRIWESPSDVEVVANAVRMLGDVAEQFTMSVTASTYSILSDVVQDQALDKLDFVKTAQFLSVESGRLCTEGTRAEFLADLLAWAMAADKPRICWVNGAAGLGKTTIAYTVCSFLRGLGLLGGSFFCSRGGDGTQRSTKFIFSTLARFLAYHDAAYARALVEVLKDPGAGSVIATEQLASLMAAPMRAAHSTGQSSPARIRVLVIDALDECGDNDQTIYDVVHRLISETHGLPLKFLITSRPEPHIIRAFDTAEQDSYLVRRVQDIPEDVAKIDIKTYLESELKGCAQSHGIGADWPPASQVQELAKQAGTLFIYASTACKYIRNFHEDPVKRLAALTAVRAQPLRGIDSMYEFVLEGVRRSKDLDTWATTRRCVQAIVRLSHPLSLGDLGDLLGIDHQDVRTALGGLQSVLRIPSSGDSNVITVFHASFPDYVVSGDRSRGKDWCMENEAVHASLLQRCIAVMKSSLRFNISNSCTSYASNHQQLFKPLLGGDLLYSCFHWIDHLEGCGNLAASEWAELNELLMERFLYWLEVLSVTGEVQMASVVLTRLLHSLHEHAPLTDACDELRQMSDSMIGQQVSPDDVGQFARDAREFVNRFARPIEESCPHIYLSALAATPRQSAVWTKISSTFKGLPNVITQQTQDVCPIFILRGHEDSVWSVAFSPDGTRVVSGAGDHTIRLWDAVAGVAIGAPLRGHEGPIFSVAFSPDGTHLVSVSFDHTIRVWDAATGAAIGDPIRGHERWVMSVAFSPDGSRIVSGSDDRTIRVWDAATGIAIGDSIRGHEGRVNIVAFSPDGARVVSGSDDVTIRIWDAATGAAIGDPLCGHGAAINSAAFSPDGTCVVSGSNDRTIRLWDAATVSAIGAPLRGHEDLIYSVAFSPDGTRVVSGCSDGTIRLWDVATGATIVGPIRSHSGAIRSIAFSPNGTRLVSGFHNRTIQLWDAATGTAIGAPLRGHEGSIYSVALSPGGRRIVSGSGDRTIRLWDAVTGAAIGDPILGHEDWILSVAFSPDRMRVVSCSSDGTVRLWDAATGAAIGVPICDHKDWVWSVAFSPDGTRVASGSEDGTIRLWDAVTGTAIGDPLRGCEGDIHSLAFSPDGTRIASGSSDRTVWLWDAAQGAAVGAPFRGHERGINSVAFSPDGARVVSGSDDVTIRLWDAATGAAIGDPLRGHGGAINSVAFSSDGTRVVSGSSDRTVRLWDAATGAALGDPIRVHEGGINSVAFSPDDMRIVSGSEDATIRLWDAATGAAVGDPLRGHEDDIDSLAFSPDGTLILSSSARRTIRRLDAESPIPTDGTSHNINGSDVACVRHGDPGPPSAVDLAHVAHPVFASGQLAHSTSAIPCTILLPDHTFRVAFSPLVAHATNVHALFSHRSGRDPRDAFTLDEAGWLRGPNDELFLWILPEYRPGLWWPRSTAIVGLDPVMLDLSDFAHGEDWTKCLQEGDERR